MEILLPKFISKSHTFFTQKQFSKMSNNKVQQEQMVNPQEITIIYITWEIRKKIENHHKIPH